MCGTAYRKAPEGARKLYNRALFDRVLVVNGRVAEPVYVEPVRLVFGGGRVRTTTCGAGDEARTRDPYLGKVVLYH